MPTGRSSVRSTKSRNAIHASVIFWWPVNRPVSRITSRSIRSRVLDRQAQADRAAPVVHDDRRAAQVEILEQRRRRARCGGRRSTSRVASACPSARSPRGPARCSESRRRARAGSPCATGTTRSARRGRRSPARPRPRRGGRGAARRPRGSARRTGKSGRPSSASSAVRTHVVHRARRSIPAGASARLAPMHTLALQLAPVLAAEKSKVAVLHRGRAARRVGADRLARARHAPPGLPRQPRRPARRDGDQRRARARRRLDGRGDLGHLRGERQRRARARQRRRAREPSSSATAATPATSAPASRRRPRPARRRRPSSPAAGANDRLLDARGQSRRGSSAYNTKQLSAKAGTVTIDDDEHVAARTQRRRSPKAARCSARRRRSPAARSASR